MFIGMFVKADLPIFLVCRHISTSLNALFENCYGLKKNVFNKKKVFIRNFFIFLMHYMSRRCCYTFTHVDI